MGAREEGTLRSYLITRDGSRRDTVVFSILDAEWPAVRKHLVFRLGRHEQRPSPAGGRGASAPDGAPSGMR